MKIHTASNMEQIREEYKYFTYLCIGLAIAAGLMLVLKIFLHPKAIVLPSLESLQPKAKLEWSLLRKPLAVNLPSLKLSLSADPPSAFVNSPVSLTAEVLGVEQGPFVYHFDCQGNDKFELDTEPTFQKKYTAKDICSFDQEGAFTPKVSVDGFFNFFKDGQEVKEKKTGSAVCSVKIASSNNAPKFSFCDVSAVEGTTQTNFKFVFTSQASDPDNDEITYEWDFGDGVKIGGQNAEYTYKKMGLYIPKVKAQDSKKAVASCVAQSLTVLKDLSPFEIVMMPQAIGRQNPFAVYKPGEKGLFAATSALPSAAKGAATTSIAQATSTGAVGTTTQTAQP